MTIFLSPKKLDMTVRDRGYEETELTLAAVMSPHVFVATSTADAAKAAKDKR